MLFVKRIIFLFFFFPVLLSSSLTLCVKSSFYTYQDISYFNIPLSLKLSREEDGNI